MPSPSNRKILALSIQQPWAWLIVHGFKSIENRTWPTHYRGPVLIHAGKKVDTDGIESILDWSNRKVSLAPADLEMAGPARGSFHASYVDSGLVGEVMPDRFGVSAAAAGTPLPLSGFDRASQTGGIVGVAEITDCLLHSGGPDPIPDPFHGLFFGPYGFVLKNAKPIDFVPCKGALGFFDVGREVISRAFAA